VSRAAGLLLGVALDRLLGDPHRWHPVAGFGTVAAALERRSYRDSRCAGAVHAVVLVGAAAALGAVLPENSTAVVGVVTWVVLGGTSLRHEGAGMAAELDAADVAAARRRLPSLCGRDPAALDYAGLARAALESVAENTCDAAVAPLLWGAVAGLPGLLAYRAVNTLDAMVGYRNVRYTRFGWAAARLDDVANLVPARVAGLFTVACAPVVGGSPRAALAAWRADAAAHPSPNAGVVEAAAAGALGVALGGETVYQHRVEQRPTLGSGVAPASADLRRAVRLSGVVQLAAALGSAALAVAISQQRLPARRRRGSGRGVRAGDPRTGPSGGGQPGFGRRQVIRGGLPSVLLAPALAQLRPHEVGQPQRRHQAERQPLQAVGQIRAWLEQRQR